MKVSDSEEYTIERAKEIDELLMTDDMSEAEKNSLLRWRLRGHIHSSENEDLTAQDRLRDENKDEEDKETEDETRTENKVASRNVKVDLPALETKTSDDDVSKLLASANSFLDDFISTFDFSKAITSQLLLKEDQIEERCNSLVEKSEPVNEAVEQSFSNSNISLDSEEATNEIYCDRKKSSEGVVTKDLHCCKDNDNDHDNDNDYESKVHESFNNENETDANLYGNDHVYLSDEDEEFLEQTKHKNYDDDIEIETDFSFSPFQFTTKKAESTHGAATKDTIFDQVHMDQKKDDYDSEAETSFGLSPFQFLTKQSDQGEKNSMNNQTLDSQNIEYNNSVSNASISSVEAITTNEIFGSRKNSIEDAIANMLEPNNETFEENTDEDDLDDSNFSKQQNQSDSVNHNPVQGDPSEESDLESSESDCSDDGDISSSYSTPTKERIGRNKEMLKRYQWAFQSSSSYDDYDIFGDDKNTAKYESENAVNGEDDTKYRDDFKNVNDYVGSSGGDAVDVLSEFEHEQEEKFPNRLEAPKEVNIERKAGDLSYEEENEMFLIDDENSNLSFEAERLEQSHSPQEGNFPGSEKQILIDKDVSNSFYNETNRSQNDDVSFQDPTQDVIEDKQDYEENVSECEDDNESQNNESIMKMKDIRKRLSEITQAVKIQHEEETLIRRRRSSSRYEEDLRLLISVSSSCCIFTAWVISESLFLISFIFIIDSLFWDSLSSSHSETFSS
jgi:hypothetical protein